MGRNLTLLLSYYNKKITEEPTILEISSSEEEDVNVKTSGLIEFPECWIYGRKNHNTMYESQRIKEPDPEYHNIMCNFTPVCHNYAKTNSNNIEDIYGYDEFFGNIPSITST